MQALSTGMDTPGPLLQIQEKISHAQRQRDFPAFIAIEGPIGVGKTTLAQRIAEVCRYPLMLEPVTDNPFLDRFYQEGRQHALPTQLFFLLHRARQAADMPDNDLLQGALVTDFLIEKDELFARLTLDEEEFGLYQQIQKSLQLNPPTPDLVIYLQAPAEVLMQRIEQRGLAFEKGIDADYLHALTERYTEFFYYYDKAPLLVVNAAEIDFANNDNHFAALLAQIIKMEGARQFFNPNPVLL
ncbi:MAG: deoxynucleoside kinase [bacterium]